MARVAPPAGYSTFPQPAGITTALIDPASGLLATEGCPEAFTEVFRQGEVPAETCNLHAGWPEAQVAAMTEPGDQTAAELGAQERMEEPREKRHPFRRWLRRVFGSSEDSQGNRPAAPPPDPDETAETPADPPADPPPPE